MGSCYSADHIAGDHIHTDITCNIKEPQQKLEQSVIDYLGWVGRGLKHVSLDPNSRFCSIQNIWST